MAEITTSIKEPSNRHLRFKLQSLGRRLDELEEATKNLQKAEDEVLDLQDKIIQAEGSNSSMLADVESLRKRVLKIEGKDEEVKKAEDMCRLMKEKLEEEESATTILKSQIEHLQKRMIALEKLEEAFSKSKNECTQLCFSLNEEKNVSKKLFTDLEILRVKIKEMEASEGKFDKTEQNVVAELEKIKSFTLIFVNERKQLLEKGRQNEKLIQELMQKLEQNDKINAANHTRNTSDLKEKSTKNNSERGDLRIEDDLSSKLPTKETKRKDNVDNLKLSENETISVSENEKNKNQEDNKIKDLNQEIEKLRTQLNHLKCVAEELKQMNAKNNVLHDKYLSEQTKNKLLTEQLEKLKLEMQKLKDLDNGVADSEELISRVRIRNEKGKSRSEPSAAKYKPREHSPSHSRRERTRIRDSILNDDRVLEINRQTTSSSVVSKRTSAFNLSGSVDAAMDDPKRGDHKPAVASYSFATKDGSMQNELKKSKEQPSVLSRYPPAAHEHNAPTSWKVSSKLVNESGPKHRAQKASRTFSDNYLLNTSAVIDKYPKTEALSVEKAVVKSHDANADVSRGTVSHGNTVLANGTVSSLKTCPASQILMADTSSVVSAVMASPTSSPMEPLEGKPCKTVVDSEEVFFLDAASQNAKPRSSSRYPRHSRNRGNVDPAHEGDVRNAHSELETRKLSSSRQPKGCTTVSTFSSEKFNLEDEAEDVSDVTSEKNAASPQPGLERKRQYSPREIEKSRMTVRTSYFDKKENETEAESNSSSTHSNSVDRSGDVNHVGGQVKRPFSPREALQSKAIIKPAIIEKDLKEIMGGIGIEANSGRLKTAKNAPSKMTSSITIYPSEPATPRTSTTAARERHTSTSNIVIAPSDLPSVSNNLGTPFEISIYKSDISVTLPSETRRPENLGFPNEPDCLTSRSLIAMTSPDETESNESSSETICWKSHSAMEVDPVLEAKTTETVKSLGRLRSSLSPLEELDTKTGVTKYCTDLPSKPATVVDAEAKTTRTGSLEPYSRRTSSAVNSLNAPPELVSRRSKSSLSEVTTRRSFINDPLLSSGLTSWNRISLQEDTTEFISRSRRKQFGSSDRLSRIDPGGNRHSAKLELQQDQQELGSKMEERIRRRKYFSEEK